MSVPIATSPGRSGFGPQLALSYDSGTGNGPFGFGWSLSLPVITRKTDKGLPQYRDAEDSDVFLLSGAEDLVPVLEPDGSRFEVLGHNFRNPYEVAVDAFGTIWQSDNDDDGNRAVRINYVMEYGNYGYTDERTGAGWRTPRTGMSDSIPLRHWHLADPGVVPNVLQTGAGSPAGIMVYEGDLLPEQRQRLLEIANRCPVHRTLESEVLIETHLAPEGL